MKKLPEKLAKVIELFELTDNIGERIDLLMECAAGNRYGALSARTPGSILRIRNLCVGRSA